MCHPAEREVKIKYLLFSGLAVLLWIEESCSPLDFHHVILLAVPGWHDDRPSPWPHPEHPGVSLVSGLAWGMRFPGTSCVKNQNIFVKWSFYFEHLSALKVGLEKNHISMAFGRRRCLFSTSPMTDSSTAEDWVWGFWLSAYGVAWREGTVGPWVEGVAEAEGEGWLDPGWSVEVLVSGPSLWSSCLSCCSYLPSLRQLLQSVCGGGWRGAPGWNQVHSLLHVTPQV